ncbi:TPA: hypothetical protein ACNU26_000824, partial [Aeromonas salmonicida]
HLFGLDMDVVQGVSLHDLILSTVFKPIALDVFIYLHKSVLCYATVLTLPRKNKQSSETSGLTV